MATSIAVQQEALTCAVSSQSLANYAAIIRGFMAKGLPESAISPRENVFTYNAWKALGRQVKKGEHGVRCLTFIVQRNKRTGREEKRPWSTTVFHISQTEKIGAIACNAQLDDLDATPENVPYAGEEEDANGYPQLSPNQTETLAAIIAPQLSIEDLHTELETSGAKFEHVKANEVSYLLTTPEQPKPLPFDEFIAAERAKQLEQIDTWTAVKFSPEATVETFTLDENCKLVRETPEVIPSPAPKDSAYDRAMRGETVSIMDIISDLQDKPKPAPKAFQLPKRLQSAVRSFQSKTVEF